MKISDRALTQALTYSGAIPFAALLVPELPFDVPASTLPLFAAYGAIIATFMSGALWGLAQREPHASIRLLVVTNFVALACWACLILPIGRMTLVVQLILFIGLLATEQRLVGMQLEKPWYWRMRMRITTIVCIFYLARIVIG